MAIDLRFYGAEVVNLSVYTKFRDFLCGFSWLFPVLNIKFPPVLGYGQPLFGSREPRFVVGLGLHVREVLTPAVCP